MRPGVSPAGCVLHSPRMFAALMIGHHFSISAFCRSPSACGRPLGGLGDFLAEIGEALAHAGIGQRLVHRAR